MISVTDGGVEPPVQWLWRMSTLAAQKAVQNQIAPRRNCRPDLDSSAGILGCIGRRK